MESAVKMLPGSESILAKPKRSSAGVFIALFGLVLIIAAWVGLAFFNSFDRNEEIARIRRENSFIASAFEEHARRIIKTADSALLHLKEEFEENGKIDQSVVNFAKLTKEDLSAIQVGIANETGELVYSAVPLAKPINISDREHFKIHRQTAGQGLYIAKPHKTEATGEWSFFMSRRVNKPDGSFGGIVSIGLDPFYFGKVYGSITLGLERSGLIVGNDHIVRVRISPVGKIVGDDISKYSPVFTEAAKAPVGSYEVYSEVDFKHRMASYRQMPDYPLIVIVSSVKDVELAPYERRKNLSILAVSLFTAFVIGFSFFLIRAENAVNRKNVQLVEELVGRKKTEDDLLETEHLFSEFMDHMPALVYLTDNEGNFLYCNEALVDFLGQDMKGRNVAAIHLPDPAAARRLIESDAETLREGRSHLEIALTHPDGGSRVLEFTKFRFTRGDKPPYLGVIAMDVTARKDAERERLDFERNLRHTQKMESLGILAGGIAHDFNNLLFGIVGNIDLAKAQTPENSKLREILDRADTAAMRATELTNQMLAYSGRGSFVIEPISISTLVGEMIPLLASVHPKLVAVRYEISDELPPVKGDATQLRQVIMNLITNAADSCEGGEGFVRVATYRGKGKDKSGIAGERVCLEVEDNGCGMDEETISRIFEPFFTTKKTGRGLGLAAVEGIVRGHGGHIHVESTPGVGTKITVCLPAAVGEKAAEASSKTAPAQTIPQAPTGKTVLLVDDEPNVLETASQYLSLIGFHVITARDGVEAIEVFRERSGEIDAIIIDMTMPRMGGVEALLKIKEINPAVPAILSSGYSSEDAVNHFKGDQIADFLQKPYRMSDLTAKLGKVLGGD